MTASPLTPKSSTGATSVLMCWHCVCVKRKKNAKADTPRYSSPKSYETLQIMKWITLPPGCKAGHCSSKKETDLFGLVVELTSRLFLKPAFGRLSINVLVLLCQPKKEGIWLLMQEHRSRLSAGGSKQKCVGLKEVLAIFTS